AAGENQPRHERHQQAHSGHRRAAEQRERGAASRAEPARHHAGGHHRPRHREAERQDHAVHESELPEVADERGQHERSDEQERPDGGGEPRAEAVEGQADERPEDAVEEEAHRDHEGEARAVEAEVGHDRLEKWPDGVADSGGDERHEREPGDHPPAVEHRSVFHVPNYTRLLVPLNILRSCVAGGRERESIRAMRYSITWSARSSSDCGIVKPNTLAVLRLMTSSNFVGCSTGRSAGFAPLRILSTYIAERRYISVRSVAYAMRPPLSVNSP